MYGLVAQAFRRAQFEELIYEDGTQLPRGTLKRKTPRERQRKPYSRQAARRLIYDLRVVLDARVWIAIAFFTGMREARSAGGAGGTGTARLVPSPRFMCTPSTTTCR